MEATQTCAQRHHTSATRDTQLTWKHILIDGQTLHKAFSLSFGDRKEEGKYRSLADKTRDKLTTALKNLRLGKNFKFYLQIVLDNLLYFQ